MSFWDEKEAKILFQKFPFFNALIEKPRIKHLKNMDLHHELPFYGELSIVKVSQAFKNFKYQIAVKVLLSKHKGNNGTEFAPVYFISTTKIVINSDKCMLDKSFQEILYI